MVTVPGTASYKVRCTFFVNLPRCLTLTFNSMLSTVLVIDPDIISIMAVMFNIVAQVLKNSILKL